MDTKLNTLRTLIQRVRRHRLRGRPSETAIRGYGSDAEMVLKIAREMQRVAEQLTRTNAERAELGNRLNELEIVERVLSRFGARSARKRLPESLAASHRPGARGGQAAGVSLSDATLRAVQAHGEGATANEILRYLAREFGMTIRPNHLGITLQRHRRAGRLDNRDQKWHMPQSEQRYLSEDEEMRA